MRKLLFRNNRCYEVGNMIKELWTQRRKLLKIVQDRQKRFISRNIIDQEKSKHSKSDPGPQKRNSREYRQRNRSLSKGQKTLHTLVVQYRVPVARQRFMCFTPHKHGVPASRLSELIARRTYYRMATAMKEKLQSGYH